MIVTGSSVVFVSLETGDWGDLPLVGEPGAEPVIGELAAIKNEY